MRSGLIGSALVAATLLAGGCQTAIRAVADPPDAALPPAAENPIRRLRRLSNREYNNVVRDLLGDASRPADRFLADSYQNGYDNGSAGLAVQSDQIVDYQAAAEALAGTAIKGNLAALLGGCDAVMQGQTACADAFVAGFAARAFRRPLSPTEAQRLRTLIDAESRSAGGFNQGIQSAVEVVLQSPQFLYREELGPEDALVAPGLSIQLTDHEVASELSFLLTGSIPDDTLWAAVAAGRFKTAADRRREAERMLPSPSARAALRAFLHQWLATDRLATLSKDRSFYPTFNRALSQSMATELDGYYDDVLWSGPGSLRALFTSNHSRADAVLAELYGITITGTGFQPVVLDPDVRKGVLTRAGWLAVHSDVDSSGPIARGVFLLQAILCAPPPQPPASVPPAKPPGDPMVKNLTTRQRFDQHVSSAFCAGCHKQIDGVGFGFEEFDAIGAHRTTENGHPVDTSGVLIGTRDIDGPFRGASELAMKLAGTRQLSDCFARQAYRYGMGQIEPTSDDLKWLTAQFDTDARLTDALLALVDNPVFVLRHFEAANP